MQGSAGPCRALRPFRKKVARLTAWGRLGGDHTHWPSHGRLARHAARGCAGRYCTLRPSHWKMAGPMGNETIFNVILACIVDETMFIVTCGIAGGT